MRLTRVPIKIAIKNSRAPFYHGNYHRVGLQIAPRGGLDFFERDSFVTGVIGFAAGIAEAVEFVQRVLVASPPKSWRPIFLRR